ncbi:Endonuclease/Exonuclease/phosphatase family protein [Symmachiella dynata]|uniref:Endonuclease/Exonuclease/phosphatase family protein n=1 Tax=Symmachiella dynata TaxID=2527995 RepID=A0A517ZK35_9PLAN|nr:endonuclease/exonuclease/phosphatase family protein [Symmachiella dynata]QDU42862.1 Endonuclease/Exonuclease/phosphatase family protein [Symmachiella dynata]
MTRIACYNVENLFARPNAFNPMDWDAGKPIIDAYHEVNELFNKPIYSAADRRRMRDLLVRLDIYSINENNVPRRKRTPTPRWAWLRNNRGSFDSQARDATQPVKIIATGRGAWIGWVELATEPTNEKATRLTGRVIDDVNADIIAIVEAEDRPSLVRFNEEMLNIPYDHVMLVDGNDPRGIDVGIMTRAGYEIESIRSNVDLTDNVGTVFSRDCAQYEVQTPNGNTVHILVNHFKSQSGGGGAKRRRQAQAVRRIVDDLVAAGEHVIVLGDLNEGPKTGQTRAENLRSLYLQNSPLIEVFTLPNFAIGNRPGTFGTCTLPKRFDYIYISQSLRQAYNGGGIFRDGLFCSLQSQNLRWPNYPDLTQENEQASDHACVFIDLNI